METQNFSTPEDRSCAAKSSLQELALFTMLVSFHIDVSIVQAHPSQLLELSGSITQTLKVMRGQGNALVSTILGFFRNVRIPVFVKLLLTNRTNRKVVIE
jgi:hypothetical protein